MPSNFVRAASATCRTRASLNPLSYRKRTKTAIMLASLGWRDVITAYRALTVSSLAPHEPRAVLIHVPLPCALVSALSRRSTAQRENSPPRTWRGFQRLPAPHPRWNRSLRSPLHRGSTASEGKATSVALRRLCPAPSPDACRVPFPQQRKNTHRGKLVA